MCFSLDTPITHPNESERGFCAFLARSAPRQRLREDFPNLSIEECGEGNVIVTKRRDRPRPRRSTARRPHTCIILKDGEDDRPSRAVRGVDGFLAETAFRLPSVGLEIRAKTPYFPRVQSRVASCARQVSKVPPPLSG